MPSPADPPTAATGRGYGRSEHSPRGGSYLSLKSDHRAGQTIMTKTTDLPVLAIDLPVMYEDEGQENMGDSWPHTITEAILRFGLMAHFGRRAEPATVLSNMNLYYHSVDLGAYVSPDIMIVPIANLTRSLRSYRIGKTGPGPFLTVEVLSERTFQQGDLTLK